MDNMNIQNGTTQSYPRNMKLSFILRAKSWCGRKRFLIKIVRREVSDQGEYTPHALLARDELLPPDAGF